MIIRLAHCALSHLGQAISQIVLVGISNFRPAVIDNLGLNRAVVVISVGYRLAVT
jgi:hypothetical protein